MSCFLKSAASVTTPSSPSHQIKRSASGRFAKALKGTSNKMALMQQGYRNYMAKRKLDFENITDENEPPSKRNKGSTQVSTVVTFYLYKNFKKALFQSFVKLTMQTSPKKKWIMHYILHIHIFTPSKYSLFASDQYYFHLLQV